MPKNVVLCCDGTANEFAKDRTNVVKLFSVLRHDPAAQASYYHPGLGTMEAAGALTPLARKVTKALGLAFGYGLQRDVSDAYVFVMRSYQPGDKLFLFGFSRGAYTARAVASLLHMYGLVQPGNEALVPYMVRMMMAIPRARRGKSEDEQAVSDYFELAGAFKSTISRVECKPWFVGLWDTVSSVGWIEKTLKLPFVSDNPDIEIGRHAIAIDERRAFFRTNLWRPSGDPPHGPKDVKQVWFPGVHSDVGGGYPEEQSGLAKVALEWMLDEAEEKGLLVDAARRRDVLGQTPGSKNTPPNAMAAPHESLKGWWRLAELVPKKHFDMRTGEEGRQMNRFRRRKIPEGSLVHAAAFERGPEYAKRLPPGAVRVERAPAAPG